MKPFRTSGGEQALNVAFGRLHAAVNVYKVATFTRRSA